MLQILDMKSRRILQSSRVTLRQAMVSWRLKKETFEYEGTLRISNHLHALLFRVPQIFGEHHLCLSPNVREVVLMKLQWVGFKNTSLQRFLGVVNVTLMQLSSSTIYNQPSHLRCP